MWVRWPCASSALRKVRVCPSSSMLRRSVVVVMMSSLLLHWPRTRENILVVCQHICYHRGMKSKEESGVTDHSPDPPLSAWTRVERIQHPKYSGNVRGSQGPLCPMSLPIVSHITPVMPCGALLQITQKGARS